jgi:hypothetical protein
MSSMGTTSIAAAILAAAVLVVLMALHAKSLTL